MGCSHGSAAPASFHQQYSLCAKLGSGNFGQVWEIRTKSEFEASSPKRAGGSSQEPYAVKICDLREEANGELYFSKYLASAAQREVEIWQLIGPNVNCVQLFNYFMEDHLCYMIMEKCECTIVEKFEEMLAATEEHLSMCVRQMLLGISHVHAAKIVHRDIKPDNFLFTDRTFKTVKLCDFGLAKKLPRRGMLYVRCGTAPYMSPEMVNDIGYGLTTDVWSCGATVHLLLCGDLPYVVPGEYDRATTIEAIRSGSPEIPFARNPVHNFPPPSECALEFTRALLDRSQYTRCSATEALQLPFLSNAPSLESLAPLSPVVACARQRISTLKQPIDQIKQRTLDEILEILQDEYKGRVDMKHAFSEPLATTSAYSASSSSGRSSGGPGFERQITSESQRSQKLIAAFHRDSSPNSSPTHGIERNKSHRSTWSGPMASTPSDDSSPKRFISSGYASEKSSGSSPMKVSL